MTNPVFVNIEPPLFFTPICFSVFHTRCVSPVIRQKDESQNEYFKKTKPTKFCKKCLFFGKFGVLCFLETPVLRFALLAYYRHLFNQELTYPAPEMSIRGSQQKKYNQKKICIRSVMLY